MRLFSSVNAYINPRKLGGQVVFADPLAENWMENLRHQAEIFYRALR
jgi:hypothetical protein